MTGQLEKVAYSVLGLLVIAGGYWIGFVGYTETKWQMGPQGYGLYEVTTTYPLAGIALFIVGLGVIAKGFDE